MYIQSAGWPYILSATTIYYACTCTLYTCEPHTSELNSGYSLPFGQLELAKKQVGKSFIFLVNEAKGFCTLMPFCHSSIRKYSACTCMCSSSLQSYPGYKYLEVFKLLKPNIPMMYFSIGIQRMTSNQLTNCTESKEPSVRWPSIVDKVTLSNNTEMLQTDTC